MCSNFLDLWPQIRYKSCRVRQVRLCTVEPLFVHIEASPDAGLFDFLERLK